LDTIILGLKELPEVDDPLSHTHVYFAHCYKNQGGWKELLGRFISGKGKLLDLEFLVDDVGRRVAAFGRSAGFIGMGVGLKQWVAQQRGTTLTKLDYYDDSDAMVREISQEISSCARQPKVFIMGALGRCGKGAVNFAERCGIKDIVQWDMNETKNGGPFPEILDADIFVNCIYLSKPIPPFITKDMLSQSRKLTVLVDVSCDTSNPHKPVPVYTTCTTFFDPCVRVATDPTLDVIAIDHLPSLVPLESSMEFSELITPHLISLGKTSVWTRAETLFNEKCKAATNQA
jgi:saccharopine dehydrogenase (NAD+, L-lysine-forming)